MRVLRTPLSKSVPLLSFLVHADPEEDVSSWMPSFPAARQCRPDPDDPSRMLVPYCLRYEKSGPNRTVFVKENGEELVCVCNRCCNALAGGFRRGCMNTIAGCVHRFASSHTSR